MDDGSKDISRELQALRNELVAQYRFQNWSQLAHVLGALAQVGEQQGQKDLCLRAQLLRSVLAEGGTGTALDPRAAPLFDELMFHLSHVQWSSETSH